MLTGLCSSPCGRDADLRSWAVFAVDFLEAVRQRVQKFSVQYIGNLPVPRAMGESVCRTG